MSLDSPVLVVFSIATNLAWYSLGVVNWHGNLKQVLVGAQHKLVIYGDGRFFFCFYFFVFVLFFFHLQLSLMQLITKIIVVLLTEYHSVIAKKIAAVLLTF